VIPRQESIPGSPRESAPDSRIPDPRFYDRPHLRLGRDRDYSLRQYQEYALADIGRFRIVAEDDLSALLYEGHRDEMERDLSSLKRQGLVQSRAFEAPDGRPREMLALTKSGYRLLRAARALPEKQTAYYGFVKPKEANHDADIYRVYREEGARISREGGTKLRVILDFELKKRLNRDFATFGAESREQIAARHGLRVVDGKIPVPDLRIEYETPEGNLGRVDLELATEHYRPRQLAEKARAGFSIYTRAGEADRLRHALEQRELTAEILTL
jgi:DNA-binding PadR family transcriptional regulator